jgi:hypothetical protein
LDPSSDPAKTPSCNYNRSDSGVLPYAYIFWVQETGQKSEKRRLTIIKISLLAHVCPDRWTTALFCHRKGGLGRNAFLFTLCLGASHFSRNLARTNIILAAWSALLLFAFRYCLLFAGSLIFSRFCYLVFESFSNKRMKGILPILFPISLPGCVTLMSLIGGCQHHSVRPPNHRAGMATGIISC